MTGQELGELRQIDHLRSVPVADGGSQQRREKHKDPVIFFAYSRELPNSTIPTEHFAS